MKMLVLASTSAHKKSLLNKLGVNFVSCAVSINTNPMSGEKPEAYARRIALLKAKKVSKVKNNNFILSHSKVIDLGNKIITKPKDQKEAVKILKRLSGKKHKVIGAVVLMKNGKACYQGVQTSEIEFNRLTNSVILEQAKTDEALENVGAYSIQGYGSKFIKSFEGNYFNVVGLPINILIRALEHLGFEITEEIKQTVAMQEKSIKEGFCE